MTPATQSDIKSILTKRLIQHLDSDSPASMHVWFIQFTAGQIMLTKMMPGKIFTILTTFFRSFTTINLLWMVVNNLAGIMHLFVTAI